MIFIIEDDELMAECISKACGTNKIKIFSNAFSAIEALNQELPELIFLDILLSGPNGFTFINEIASYPDTSQIPIVIISSLDFSGQDLENYGVVGTINKDTLVPKEIKAYVKRYTN